MYFIFRATNVCGLHFSKFSWFSAIGYFNHSVIHGFTRIILKDFDEEKLMQVVEKYKVS